MTVYCEYAFKITSDSFKKGVLSFILHNIFVWNTVNVVNYTLKIQTPGVSVDEGENDSAMVYKIEIHSVIVVIVLGKFRTTSSRTSNNK